MKPQRKTVRANQLENRLDGYNAEIGEKVALLLREYHTGWVAPIAERAKRAEWAAYTGWVLAAGALLLWAFGGA